MEEYLKYKFSLLLDIACEASRIGVKDEELDAIITSTKKSLGWEK